jgi:8-oxo-dGTP pyrophosphatase MutT (NUDIX family)
VRSAAPAWFGPLEQVLTTATADQIGRFLPPSGHHRRSAVLLLFGALLDEVDVLLTERAPTLRAHAGQVAFPGGRMDDEDSGPVAAALREATEETGLDPAAVTVAGCLPELYLPVSDYTVTPVLAWWAPATPAAVPLWVMDPAEVSRVARVPVAELVEPANRFLARHPSGFISPGFAAAGMFVWGFTALILDGVLRLAGWEQDWDRSRVKDVPL